MYKKAIILLTFLAYAVTLMHSLVPHTHHEEAASDHAHHHHGPDAHHHQNDHGNDHDEEAISDVFTDAIHHPASEVVLHAPESKVIQKKTSQVDILLIKLSDLLNPELKSPDVQSVCQTKYQSSDQDTFFLLRAPPVA